MFGSLRDGDQHHTLVALAGNNAQSMIRKSVQRFSEKHALGPDPWDHAQSKT
jgi:hypothetical protein